MRPEQLDIIFERSGRGLFFSALQAREAAVDPVNKNLAREILKRFGQERKIVGPLRNILNPRNGGGVPENLAEFMVAIHNEESKLSTMNVVPRVEIAPAFGTPLPPASIFQLTGVPFIDGPLGGQREGDANGLLGVTGGGKTTFAIHIATSLAKQCFADGIRPGDKHPSWVGFATFEEPPAKLQPRLWSSAFAIPRAKLEVDFTWDSLTTHANLADYERRMQQGADILSEADRYRRDAPILSQCFDLWDLSGSDEHPQAGYGSVPEIASYVARTVDAKGVTPRAVFIDYAGLAVQRYCQAKNWDLERHYRLQLKLFAEECRRLIAMKYSCTVWILHQVNGQAIDASPSKLLRIADADECKTFAVNTAVCGCIGPADTNTGCRFLNWDKVRYRPPQQVPPVLLRMDDMFAMMRDVTSQYEVDGKSFIAKDDIARIAGNSDSEAQVAQLGPIGARNAEWNVPL